MKSAKKAITWSPDLLKVGERYLLAFHDPEFATPHLGRLQDLNSDYLCIDAPAELKPPRGTPVTLSSLQPSTSEYSFSSEILGRRRLHGRLPVLLIKRPEEIDKTHQRSDYRVSVTLRSRVEWVAEDQQNSTVSKPAVLTNLSGGGGQVFLRSQPSAKKILVTVDAPDEFIQEWAKRHSTGLPSNRPMICKDPIEDAADRARDQLRNLDARIVTSKICTEDGKGPIYTISIAFLKPQESCYRLVRFLERQALKKGLRGDNHQVATAA